jgi:hypothetical protein
VGLVAIFLQSYDLNIDQLAGYSVGNGAMYAKIFVLGRRANKAPLLGPGEIDCELLTSGLTLGMGANFNATGNVPPQANPSGRSIEKLLHLGRFHFELRNT